jgi:putative intracellular protease/amidase
VFYPGGHGPLWDLTDNADSLRLIETLYAADKPVASVCHAPTVLINAKDKSGRYLVENKNITAFSNSEEDGVGLSQVVPFLLEDALKQRGAVYHKGEDWASFVQVDGQLITGQNPASSAETAKALLQLLA